MVGALLQGNPLYRDPLYQGFTVNRYVDNRWLLYFQGLRMRLGGTIWMDSGMRMQQLKLNVRMMAQQLPLLQTQQLPVSTISGTL